MGEGGGISKVLYYKAPPYGPTPNGFYITF